jgi:hypothetical protein
MIILSICAGLLTLAAIGFAQEENEMKIELIYFEGCPNMDPAKVQLSRALEKLDLDVEFEVWKSDDTNAPEYASRYGSPSILLNERDIFGAPPSPNPSCRLYGKFGYPMADEIIEKMQLMSGGS